MREKRFVHTIQVVVSLAEGSEGHGGKRLKPGAGTWPVRGGVGMKQQGWYARHWRVALAGVALLALYASAGDFVPGGPCTRGRVRMNGTTIVTDWGTLLRGACWALDMIKNVPPREDLATIKQCGVNCVHVYFERYDAPYGNGGAGYNVDKMDTLVEWCRQESLYVIMTIGGSIVGPYSAARQVEVDKCKAIWALYAPRYADQTHVVYEVKNEPDMFQSRVEGACYPVMHEAAPNTHVLLGSYSTVINGVDWMLNPIRANYDIFDWDNTSIAFHGYDPSGHDPGPQQEGIIKGCNDSGYCVTMTECWANTGLEEHYEKMQISYCPMKGCFTPMATQKCEGQHKLNPSYAPDFGSWPQEHIEYPTLTEWEPWNNRTQQATTQAYRLTIGALPRGNVTAVYDISGRTLWRQRENSANPGVTQQRNSRVLVVDYGKR